MAEFVSNLLDVNSSSTEVNPERSPFDSLYTNLSQSASVGNSNLPGGGINPFAGDGGAYLQNLIFTRLKLILGNDFPNDSNNPFITGGSNPFVMGEFPVGNGNSNFGINNATIGNFNLDFASDSATIGNGNWNFNINNTTIGNGNWKFGGSNTTIGNGNWYWDDGNNNATLGNGNWYFGTENTTIGNGNWYWDYSNNNATLGNGNWDFGTNNTIVGNGNWIFTDNNTVFGNGNWLVDSSNINVGIGENFVLGTRTNIDNIINSLVGRIGQDFIGLTGNFGDAETQTFNRLILARGNDLGNNNLSTNIEQLLSLFSSIPTNQLTSQPQATLQPVPESTSPVSLIAIACVFLLLFKSKKVLRRE